MIKTEHFSELEFTRSDKAMELGLDNSLPEELRPQALFTLAGMERIRASLNYPLKIDSGYRCARLNVAVGGSVNSQHMRAEACDFICPQFGSPYAIALQLQIFIESLGIDELILEHTWVHVSFTHRPRYQIVTMVNGRYLEGLHG